MIKEFKEKKYQDYYNLKDAWECKISIMITCIVILILSSPYVDIFNNFMVYKESIKNIFIYFASGLLGVIGVSLAGIGLVLSLFDLEF